MRARKPRIGYTTRDFTLDPLHLLVAVAIRLAGGVPVRLRPKRPRHGERIDGLVIGGGTDLYPALYMLDPKPDYQYDHERDELEIAWLEHAEKEDLPVLGICRGAQLLNAYRGGTLHVDVGKIYENAKYPAHLWANIFFRKAIVVKEGSLLRRLLGVARTRVNSMHKQAIDKLGTGLQVSAEEDNGVVQAVEDPAHRFCLGVQFHPEALIHRKRFRNIFAALVKAAAG